jgi:Flp pilus assembly protein TadC
MEWIILGLTMISATMAAFSVLAWLRRDQLAVIERLDKYTREMERERTPAGLNDPLSSRVKSLFGGITRILSGKLVRRETRNMYEEKLMAAGYPMGLNVDSFLALKYIIFILTLILGVISRNVLIFIALGAFGLLIPNFFLKSSEKNRKTLILKSLPDVLDLLSVSVEAGLGFDQAIQKVTEKTRGPLSEEFEKTLQEINMGKQRREALRDMANRVGVDDVTVFFELNYPGRPVGGQHYQRTAFTIPARQDQPPPAGGGKGAKDPDKNAGSPGIIRISQPAHSFAGTGNIANY